MQENRSSPLSAVLFILYICFCVSLVFSFRAISSVAIALIFVAGLIKNKIGEQRFFRSELRNALLIFCLLFFLLQFASLLFTSNSEEGWRSIRMKTGLLVIPAALLCCDFLDEEMRRKIMKWYCLGLLASCLIALYVASERYLASHDVSVFLYHSLVSIYDGHAVQYSIMVFIAVAWLTEMSLESEFLIHRWFQVFLILFFSLMMILLSSKLVISFLLLYFVVVLGRSFVRTSAARKFIGICILVLVAVSVFTFIIPNYVSNRFREVVQTDFGFLGHDRFTPADYFNGLQFRMLQWRFVPQILNEKHAWLTGVGPGDAQQFLDQKYISTNMYIGNPGRSDRGYLGYNTHNQFLESLLQSGLPGALLFILIACALIRMAVKQKRIELIFVTSVLVAYSLTESVFESQYSMFIFLFFPLFFYPNGKNREK